MVTLYSNALTSDGVCSGRIRLVPAVCLMSRRQWAPCPSGIPPLCLQDYVDLILIPMPRKQGHTMLLLWLLKLCLTTSSCLRKST